MISTPAEANVTNAAQDFAEAHSRLLANHAIQFDLPREVPTPPPDLGWLDALIGMLSPVVKVAFWPALIGGILFVIYVIAMRLAGVNWRRWPTRGKTPESLQPAEAPARQLLAEADALAAEGRFSEAARLLLFRSIEDIDSRRPDQVRPALTSRDIAALPAIPERPRSAFVAIAMLVERSLFGARALGEGDWRDCRSAYEEFAFADGWHG
jgi:hypothetical protein